MRLYGFTVVSSTGNILMKTGSDGRKHWCWSMTKIFPSKEERLAQAIKEMEGSFDKFGFPEGKDASGSTKDDIAASFAEGYDDFIQGTSGRVAFKFFEQDIAVDTIEVETPDGKLVAKVHGKKDDFPAIWVTHGASQKMIAAVAYNTREERIQIEAYEKDNKYSPRCMIDYATGEDLL